MIFQFMWSLAGGGSFEKSVPVLWHGEHLRRNGWENRITLCFLQGLELLSSEYRKQLVVLGYEVLDCSALVEDISCRYPQSRMLKATSRYWFLRWNVLQRLAVERSLATVIHLDGDVVLLVNPQDLYQDVVGKTFMLQGCPALTVISDDSWFEVWNEELEHFLANRSSYLARAMAEKISPHRPDREFCNVCAYGSKRFEDQDMLEYLIASGKLPQDPTTTVFDSEFYWIQNPLLPGDWHEEQVAGAPRTVHEKDGIAYVCNKKIAFYHFQNDFARYCRTWQQFSRIGLENLASLLRPAGAGRRTSGLIAATGLVMDMLNRRTSRRAVYEAVFTLNPATGNRYITEIVNSCWN